MLQDNSTVRFRVRDYGQYPWGIIIQKEDELSSDVIEKNEALSDVYSALGLYIGRNKKKRNCCALVVTIVGLLWMEVITKEELLAKLTNYYDNDDSNARWAAPLPAGPSN